jgi:hypothetical protein
MSAAVVLVHFSSLLHKTGIENFGESGRDFVNSVGSGQAPPDLSGEATGGWEDLNPPLASRTTPGIRTKPQRNFFRRG